MTILQPGVSRRELWAWAMFDFANSGYTTVVITDGSVTWLTGGDHRLAILTIGAYFVIGLALLAGVDVERGRRAAASDFER